MQVSDLKQLERIRVLRRDRHAVRLAQLRLEFEPIDGMLAGHEADLENCDAETRLLNSRIQKLSDARISDIQLALDSVESQIEAREDIERSINQVHGQRLTLLGSIRSARNDWRNAGRACDRWAELLAISAEVSDYNDRVAEENSSSEAVFYIKNLKA